MLEEQFYDSGMANTAYVSALWNLLQQGYREKSHAPVRTG